jgi:hypothetical protein
LPDKPADRRTTMQLIAEKLSLHRGNRLFLRYIIQRPAPHPSKAALDRSCEAINREPRLVAPIMLCETMNNGMTELTERLAGLPEAEREQWLKRFASEIDLAKSTYRLTDEERALVAEGIADLDAGRIVAGAELEAFWNRNRRT